MCLTIIPYGGFGGYGFKHIPLYVNSPIGRARFHIANCEFGICPSFAANGGRLTGAGQLGGANAAAGGRALTSPNQLGGANATGVRGGKKELYEQQLMDAVAAFNNMIGAVDIRQQGGGFATPGMQQQAGRVGVGLPGAGMQSAMTGAGMPMQQPQQMQGMDQFNRLSELWNKVNQEKVIVDQSVQQSVLQILGGQGQQQMMGMNPMGGMMNPMGGMMNPMGGMMNPMGGMMNPMGGMMNPMGNMMNPMGNMMNPMGNMRGNMGQMHMPHQPQMHMPQAPQVQHGPNH